MPDLRSWRRVARSSSPYALPALVTLSWLIYVLAAGELSRVATHWESALTMTVGSFLAGSTPAGGGTVAFPIFTKALDVPVPVARTFALCIQAVGMTTAALIILITRRPVEPRAILLCVPMGLLGFFASLFLLGDADALFWPSDLSAGLVKVSFTIVLSATALMMFLMLRAGEAGSLRVPRWNARLVLGLALAAILGGGITAWVGTGVNVLLFLLLVLIAGLHPRAGVATSVVTMAAISVAGLLTLGIADGQLDIGLDAAGDVVRVGGAAVGPIEGGRYDLAGLWLAAVPVVVWGAPLGAWVVHVLHERRLIAFIGLLALAEVVSTVVLLDALHRDAGLIAYFLGGMTVALGGVLLARRYRAAILGLPAGP